MALLILESAIVIIVSYEVNANLLISGLRDRIQYFRIIFIFIDILLSATLILKILFFVHFQY